MYIQLYPKLGIYTPTKIGYEALNSKNMVETQQSN